MGAFMDRGRTLGGQQHCRRLPSIRYTFAGGIAWWKVAPIGECTQYIMWCVFRNLRCAYLLNKEFLYMFDQRQFGRLPVMVVAAVNVLLCVLAGVALGIAWLRSSPSVAERETANSAVEAAPDSKMCAVEGGSPLSPSALAGSNDLVIAGYRPLSYDVGGASGADSAEPTPAPPATERALDAGSAEPTQPEADAAPMGAPAGSPPTGRSCRSWCLAR